MRWILWLSVACALGILGALVVKLFVIDPQAENAGMQFSRTVHDPALAEELAESPTAIFAAGPLLRPAEQRQELIEFTSDLEPRASTWIDRNYVCAFEQQEDGSLRFLDNGSLLERPARAFTFTVDDESRTATVRTLVEDPAAAPSMCTGSFTAFDQARYWVAGWGCSRSGITVFDDSGTPIVSTSLDPTARRNLELTDQMFGGLRWTMSYRATPGEPAPFLTPRS